MTTAEQNGCYTHIPFLIQILCYYFAHENRNYPFCSTCLFFQIYGSEYQILNSKFIVSAPQRKSNPVFLFFTLIFVNTNDKFDSFISK